MAESVEEILREIHVTFAKCPVYDNSPDLIVVSKQEMFELFEKLNEALGEELEKYEATTLSRERARIEMEREKAALIASAKQSADDVHAASLLYTDNMIESIDRILDSAKSKVKHDMLEAIAAMEDISEILIKNRDGVKTELSQMHDNETYLELIEKLRKRAEEKRRLGEDAPEEDIFPDDKPAAAKLDIRVNKPGENSGVTLTTRRTHKSGKKKPAGQQAAPAEHEEGMPYSAEEFDLDKEYFDWQEEQEGGQENKGKKKKWSIFSKK